MRALVFTLVILPLIGIAPEVQADKAAKFAGISSLEITGGEGIHMLMAICREDFGSKARMCTTQDFLNGTRIVVPTGGRPAWVQPVPVAFTGTALVDVTGRIGVGETLNCDGWTNVAKGMAITDEGELGFHACSTVRPVACCKQ